MIDVINDMKVILTTPSHFFDCLYKWHFYKRGQYDGAVVAGGVLLWWVYKAIYKPMSVFVYNLVLKLNKESGTLKMGTSNIVYILNRLKIQHIWNVSELTHFSEQNLQVLCSLLYKKYHIEIDRALLTKLIWQKFNKQIF